MHNGTKLATLLISGLALAAGTGCQSNPGADISYDKPAELDQEFADGADRKPSPKTLFQMAKLLESQGRKQEAAATMRTCIDRYPKYKPAHLELAQLFLRVDRADLAVRTLESALEIMPGDGVILNDLGMAHMMGEEHALAATRFREAVEMDEANTRYMTNLALAIGMQGRYEEALAIYRQVLAPDRAHYNLGVICEARGDNERAQLEFRIARGEIVKPIEQTAVDAR